VVFPACCHVGLPDLWFRFFFFLGYANPFPARIFPPPPPELASFTPRPQSGAACIHVAFSCPKFAPPFFLVGTLAGCIVFCDLAYAKPLPGLWSRSSFPFFPFCGLKQSFFWLSRLCRPNSPAFVFFESDGEDHPLPLPKLVPFFFKEFETFRSESKKVVSPPLHRRNFQFPLFIFWLVLFFPGQLGGPQIVKSSFRGGACVPIFPFLSLQFTNLAIPGTPPSDYVPGVLAHYGVRLI